MDERWWLEHPNNGWIPASVCDALAALEVGWRISLGCPLPPSEGDKLLESMGYDPQLHFYDGDCGCA